MCARHRILEAGSVLNRVKYHGKLFGRISGYIILFLPSQQGHLDARNFVVISFNFFPFTTYEKTSFTE